MKTAKSRAPYIKFPAKPALWIFAAVAFALTTGICSADSIGVACALPYVQGSADATCSGQHTVQITTSNLDSNATITTELLGLNENGALIKSFSVKNGATVQLGSRLSEASWQFTQTGSLTTVYAPVPLLHVTVQDRGLTAEAFCSDIPFLEIEQPAGNEPWRAGLFPEASSVVTDASGNNTNIVAVAPLTNPASMHLYVDGTDLLTLVPGYLACTPGAPCNGAVTINGQSVAYSNLILDIASSIGTPASNTARVTLTNLTCGEHLFRVSSAKNASYPGTVNNTCNVDSLSKPARSSVFTISITDPAPGQITIVPTPVAGEVCSGTKITGVNVNGMNLSVAGETYTPGNASTTGDV
ncbi:MAG: hypothetical protein JOZ22_14755, partial [Acidobacteriia bacterium]|nr:hypothetical protein [Terriglobia bacterium]